MPSNFERLQGEYERLYKASSYREAKAAALQLMNETESGETGSPASELGEALFCLGSVEERLGELKPAAEHLQRALEILERELGPDHAKVGDVLQVQGRRDYYASDYAEAQPRLERALALHARANGEKSGDVLNDLNLLADVRVALGQFEQAEKDARQAMAIAEEPGITPVDRAEAIASLAYVLGKRGKLRESEKLNREAYLLRREHLGPDHADTGKSANNYAQNLLSRSAFAEAAPLQQQALASAEKAYGPETQQVAIMLNNLGGLYRELGEYEKVAEYYERSLAIKEKVLPPDHPSLAVTLGNLAGHYKSRADFPKAQKLYERALAITEQKFGPAHPSVAADLNNLASVLGDQGKNGEARALYERALAMQEQAHGPDHPTTGIMVNNVALFYEREGQFHKALEMYRRALAIREGVNGPEHLEVAIPLNNMAGVYHRIGDNENALKCHERARAIREKLLGPDHPDMASSYNGLGVCYQEAGRNAEARAMFEKALEINTRVFGHDHLECAIPLNNLATLDFSEGHKEEARKKMERVLAIQRRFVGENNDRMHLTRQNAIAFDTGATPVESRAAFEKLLQEITNANGPDHYSRIVLLANIGGTYLEEQDFEKARRYFAEAIEVSDKSEDKSHLVQMRYILAAVLLGQGHPEEAQAVLQQAQAAGGKQNVPDSVALSVFLPNLLANITSSKDAEKLLPLLTRVLLSLERTVGANDPVLALQLVRMGLAHLKRQAYRQGELCLDRAVAIMERVHGEEHPNLIPPLVILSKLAAQRGDLERKEQLVARARRIQRSQLNPLDPRGLLMDAADGVRKLFSPKSAEE